jgi:hypothetical protein
MTEAPVRYIQEGGVNSEISIPNAGQCGGVSKSEQTAFLTVVYDIGEEVKGLSCGSVRQLDP